MVPTYFFVRLRRGVLENDLRRVRGIGKIERVEHGTVIDPEAYWAVLVVYLPSPTALRAKFREQGCEDLVEDIREIGHPEEGRAMAQQLGLF